MEEIKDNELLFTQGYEDLTNDFLWLIEQAERVQELERTTSEYLYSSKYLLEQNKRYRGGIEFALNIISKLPSRTKGKTIIYKLLLETLKVNKKN